MLTSELLVKRAYGKSLFRILLYHVLGVCPSVRNFKSCKQGFCRETEQDVVYIMMDIIHRSYSLIPILFVCDTCKYSGAIFPNSVMQNTGLRNLPTKLCNEQNVFENPNHVAHFLQVQIALTINNSEISCLEKIN